MKVESVGPSISHSLELVVEPWIESLWFALDQIFSSGASICVAEATNDSSVGTREISTQNNVLDDDLPPLDQMSISGHLATTASGSAAPEPRQLTPSSPARTRESTVHVPNPTDSQTMRGSMLVAKIS